MNSSFFSSIGRRQLRLFFFLSVSLFAASTLSAQEKDFTRTTVEGIYRGKLTTPGGVQVPLELTLALGEGLENTASNELWDKMLPLSSSVVVDDEGGPYTFQSVKLDPMDGKIEFVYFRTGRSGRPDFRLTGKITKPGEMQLEAFSNGRGRLGQVTLVQTSKIPTPLQAKPKYVGIYNGIWTMYPSGRKERLRIHLVPAGLSSTNPETYEFDFSIGRTGSAHMGTEIPFHRVNFDYFTQSFSFVYLGIESRTITLSGKYTDRTLVGIADSSLNGKTGTFEATKE